MKKKKIKHYAEYYFPGAFVCDTSVSEIPSRDINKMKIPKNCVGFLLYDIVELEHEGDILTSTRKNLQRVHIGTTLEINKWDKVVKSPSGYYQPIELTDIVIAPDSFNGRNMRL